MNLIQLDMNYNFKNNVEYKFILKSKSTFNTCYKHCNTLIFVTVKAINYEVVIKFRLSRSLTEQHNSKCVIWISPKLRKIYKTHFNFHDFLLPHSTPILSRLTFKELYNFLINILSGKTIPQKETVRVELRTSWSLQQLGCYKWR